MTPLTVGLALAVAVVILGLALLLWIELTAADRDGPPRCDECGAWHPEGEICGPLHLAVRLLDPRVAATPEQRAEAYRIVDAHVFGRREAEARPARSRMNGAALSDEQLTRRWAYRDGGAA